MRYATNHASLYYEEQERERQSCIIEGETFTTEESNLASLELLYEIAVLEEYFIKEGERT